MPKHEDAEPSALQQASTSDLVTELIGRGQTIRAMSQDLVAHQCRINLALAEFDDSAKGAKATVQNIATSAEQTLKDLIALSKDQLKSVAKTTEATCLERVQALETQCLKRVSDAEAACRATVESVTTLCNQRAEAAEAETLKCIEQADRAVASLDALGKSCNTLNERVHGMEISLRTIFSGGSPTIAPIYTPAGVPAQQAAPLPFVLPTPVAPPAVVVPLPAAHNNGKHRESDRPKMQFVLLGLHQKNIEHIRQKLRQPTNRGVSIIVVENTSEDLLPKSADYAIVAGAHDLNRRWKFCLETYGPSKCVRLTNSSVITFREKIEELFEARYPQHAPDNLNPVGKALNEAAQRFASA